MGIIRNEKGTTLIVALSIVMVVGAMASVYLTLAAVESKKASDSQMALQSLYLAESAMAESMRDLANGGTGVVTQYNQMGHIFSTTGDPCGEREIGTYRVDVVDDSPGKKVLRAYGDSQDSGRIIEFIMTRGLNAVYENAIFAGNSTNDPTYTMPFGGVGAQGDDVTGDVYSGGDITASDDASITGTARAKGTITGDGMSEDPEEGVTQPIPDLQGMDYSSIADVKVSDQFADHGYYTSDDAGGSAYQVPEEYAAHIFRKNPTDRATECSGTVKDDYFIEDPYEPVRTDPNQNGSDAYHITFGDESKGQEEGNHKIYYVDGNVWIHNKKSYSFKFYDEHSAGVTATFVVKGNVYFSDNTFYTNKNKDGVAFIAMKDPDVDDSGNIYIGDPVYGTVGELNSFLYAEDTFYDLNLDEEGSYNFEIYGNMTAGNHVDINRDFVVGGTGHYECSCCGLNPWKGYSKCNSCKGSKANCKVWMVDPPVTDHSQMTVVFDDRVARGAVAIPGLPTGGNIGSWQLACRREVFEVQSEGGGQN